MAKLNLIKKLVNKDTVNSFNLILNVLFGGKTPELYDENKIYNKGDCVIIEKDGVHTVVTITKDNVTGPFNPENTGEVVFTDLYKDSSILTQNNTIIQTKQEALSDDIATLVYELAGLVDHRLSLKVLYRDNFKDLENIKLVNGLHVPGSIQAVPGVGLEFTLNNPIQLLTQPTTYKLKHIIELIGVPTIGCSITFNALDKKPYWFNANDAILSADFFEIPKFDKDVDVPYALNIRIFGECAANSSLKISDLMVVFV